MRLKGGRHDWLTESSATAYLLINFTSDEFSMLFNVHMAPTQRDIKNFHAARLYVSLVSILFC